MHGPIWISKWDIYIVCLSHMGKFAYVVVPLPYDPTKLLSINLVLLMFWVN